MTESSTKSRLNARYSVYKAAADYLPEGLPVGAGVGNFWGPWGLRSHFANYDGSVSGSHNMPVQVVLYWGVLPRGLFVLMIWMLWRCFPSTKEPGGDRVGLIALAICMFVLAQFMHNLYNKNLSIVIGLLVGARLYIWARVSATRGAPTFSHLRIRAPRAAHSSRGLTTRAGGSRGG